MLDCRYKIRIAATVMSRSDKLALLTDFVSERGLYLRTDDPPPVMQLLRVKLVLPPTGREILVHGMVTRVMKPELDGSGVPGAEMTFYALDGDAARGWSEFLTFVRVNHPEALQRPVVLAEHKKATDQIHRRHPRRAIRVSVDMAIGAATTRLITSDISEGGIFIPTSDPPPVGTILSVSLAHPRSPSRLRLECIVRRSVRGPNAGVGLELRNLTAEARASLLELIAHHESANHPARADREEVAAAVAPPARPSVMANAQ